MNSMIVIVSLASESKQRLLAGCGLKSNLPGWRCANVANIAGFAPCKHRKGAFALSQYGFRCHKGNHGSFRSILSLALGTAS